jgi:hypothetical protein
MALVECPDCEKEISNTAKNCPHCGADIWNEGGMILFVIACSVVVTVVLVVLGKLGII